MRWTPILSLILPTLGGFLLLVSCAFSRSPIVEVDGSSTVFPISEAMAEEHQNQESRVLVTVGVSGTGGGFKKFCNGEIAIAGASRPIQPTEIEACDGAGIQFIELPVAMDGLSIVVNQKNDWATFLTVEELKRIWEPGSTIFRWSQIRPEWPNREIFLVGADTDSGTFDYFTEAVVGKAGASRADYTASADDNVLVQGVTGELYSLGYFGYAYYIENASRLNLVAIDDGLEPVLPTEETISNGIYKPLSRPLFIYVNRQKADRPEVDAFVRFYLNPLNAPLVAQVGYVRLAESIYSLVRERFAQRVIGTVFKDGSFNVGIPLEELLTNE